MEERIAITFSVRLFLPAKEHIQSNVRVFMFTQEKMLSKKTKIRRSVWLR